MAVELNYLVSSFGGTKFLLAHGGGYDLQRFIQIARFNKNCFIDFSATVGIFSKTNMFEIHNWLNHCNIEPRIRDKVLFGSDFPEFCVDQHMAVYSQFFDAETLRVNFWKRFLDT